MLNCLQKKEEEVQGGVEKIVIVLVAFSYSNKRGNVEIEGARWKLRKCLSTALCGRHERGDEKRNLLPYLSLIPKSFLYPNNRRNNLALNRTIEIDFYTACWGKIHRQREIRRVTDCCEAEGISASCKIKINDWKIVAFYIRAHQWGNHLYSLKTTKKEWDGI